MKTIITTLALITCLAACNQVSEENDPVTPTASTGVEQHDPQAITCDPALYYCPIESKILCDGCLGSPPLPYVLFDCQDPWGACSCSGGTNGTCVDPNNFLPDCDWKNSAPAPNEAFLAFHADGDPMNIQCKKILNLGNNPPWNDFELPDLSVFHATSNHSSLWKIKTGANFYGYLYPGTYYAGNGCIIGPGVTKTVAPSPLGGSPVGWYIPDQNCSNIFANTPIRSIHFYKYNSSINP